jgi:hypothetical protein
MKTKLIFIIINILINLVGTPAMIHFMPLYTQQSPPPYEPVLFNEFPVPLYNVFYNHSLAEKESLLHSMEYGGAPGPTFINPYPYILNLDHYPLNGKWYIRSGGLHLEIKIDVDSYMEISPGWESKPIQNINGTDKRMDLRLALYLSHYISLSLDHVNLNESLVQNYESALSMADIDVFGHNKKAVFIPANTTIGVSNLISFDFAIYDTFNPIFPNYPPDLYDSFIYQVNPFFYFTAKAKDEIWSYYIMQYDAMKNNGGIVMSRLNNTLNHNEAGTLYGMWFAESWPYYLNQTNDDYMGKYWYDGSILNMINVNKTNNESFYKDIETDLPFAEDMIGMYGDADFENVDNYTVIGANYMYLLEGNLSQGIINLTKYHTNERSRPVYMKYELIPSAMSIYYDKLYVEYFDNLTKAQGNFTEDKLIYIRSTQERGFNEPENGISGYYPMVMIGIIGIISIVLISRRRKLQLS